VQPNEPARHARTGILTGRSRWHHRGAALQPGPRGPADHHECASRVLRRKNRGRTHGAQ